ncbi:phospholipase A and acyltransferase 4-like [Centroberyx affinis]|uniref:phospholipase A and acyltransferase 4-like n=1 Tax=Centroberyx affinis TaxID=166261 RepID=UPI003A5BE11E
MDLMGQWNSILSQITEKQIDKNVSTAEIGDLIEFVYQGTGFSLWGVYDGDGHVIHFGVADENLMQRVCRSFLQQMVQHSSGDRLLKRTKIRRQPIAQIKVPLGTRIKVNNNKHRLSPSPQDLMRHRCDTFLDQEFTYDLLNFNSEHFATFVRYGRAVCNQIPFKKKDEEHTGATQTFDLIMQQRMETEI